MSASRCSPFSAIHLHFETRRRRLLAVAAGAAKGSAQGGVLVGEVEDVLGEGGALYDAAYFDGAFFLDEFADCVEEGGGELVGFG